MIEYLLIAGVGAWFAGRSAPRTKVEKGKSYGPKTGVQWDTEWFPELGVLVVEKNGTKAVFRRAATGLVFERATGDARMVAVIRKDFEP